MHTAKTDHWRWFITVAVLASLAFAQPLYSKLGAQAEFFVAHGLSATDLLLLCLLLSVLVPAALGSLPLLVRAISPRLATLAFHGLVALLACLVALPPLALLGIGGYAVLGASLAIGMLISLAWAKTAFVRLLLVWLAPSILIFPLVFLLFSRVSALVLPAERVELAGVAGGSSHHVVVLVLDEFPLVSLLTPALDIDHTRYPNFARLAERSHWFAGASSAAEGTVIAVPTALTGLEPGQVQGKLPLAGNFPDNLFTRLQSSHQVRARETATLLCPRELCGERTRSQPGTPLAGDLWIVWQHIVVPRPWSERLPPLANAWAGFGQVDKARLAASDPGLQHALAVADWAEQQDWYQRSAQFREFIREILPAERPQLHYLHALLPHAPWNYLPDGRQYAFGENSLATGLSRDSEGVWRWTTDPWPVWQAWQRHLLQVAYLDGLVGKLLDHLNDLGLMEETLLVVMGDHGGAFVPGEPRREVSPANVTDITAVPLFVKLPGQTQGQRHDHDARLEDVLPTVLQDLEMSHPGTSLLEAPPAGSRGPIEVRGRSGLSLAYSHEEHMRHLAMRAQRKAELFGTGDDPQFYAIGPERDLLGTPAPAVTAQATAPKVEFEGQRLYLEVDPEGDFVPRLVRGRLHGTGADARQALAITVNGSVQATTWAIGGRFTALLGPDALRIGANELGAFLIQGTGDERRLSALPRSAADAYTLTSAPGGASLQAPDGTSIPVVAGSPGRVSGVPAEGESLYYLTGSVPAELGAEALVLAFRGAALAAAGQVSGGRRNFSLPVASEPAVGALRVFVLPDGRGNAMEFEYSASCQEAWLFRNSGRAGAEACDRAPSTPLVSQQGRWQATLEFGDAQVNGLLGPGWGNGGSGVRWTIGKSARLRIPLTGATGPLHFEARIKPYLAPPKLPQQEFWVLANGEPVGQWSLDQPGFQSIEWTVEAEVLAIEPGQLELRFLIPEAQAPRALGAGPDARSIGIAFRRLEVRGPAVPPP